MREKGKLRDALGNLDVYLAQVILAALIVLTFTGALKRYLFRSPIAWMEEVQMVMFLWMVFLSAGAAFRAGGHIAIEILVDTLPKKLGALIEKVDVLIQLIIVGYLTVQSCVFYLQFVQTSKTTIFLHIPYTLTYAVLPIGCVLMLVGILYAAYQSHMAKKGGEAA